jgi:Dolichyl-phosphate-mannose-protein mannosyltransferase
MTTARCASLARWLESHRSRSLVLIVLFALLVDGVWLWTHPPGFESGETFHWWPTITNVARGHGYSGCDREYFPFCGATNQTTAAREPVPVLLFAAVARLTGESLLAGGIVEIGLNLAIVVGIFLLAWCLAGPLVALAAALLWSLYLPALKLIPQVSGDLVATLGVVWGTYFLVRAQGSGRVIEWLAAGVCVGLAVLSRSAFLVLAPALALPGLFGRSATGRSRWRGLAWFGGACLVTIAPWVVRNAVVFERPVIGSTLSGYNLYRENYQLALPDDLHYVAGREAARAIRELVARRPDLRGTENEAEMNAVYAGEAFRVIRTHPLRYIQLCAYRFPMLWFNWGYLEAYGSHARWEDHVVDVEQAVLLCLAVAGLARLGRPAWPLAAAIAALSLAYMLVNSQLRYIVPVMPLAMVLGAAVLVRRFRLQAVGVAGMQSPG